MDIRDGRCPKCSHHRILHVTEIADRIGEIGGGRMDQGRGKEPEPGQFYPLRIARVPNPDGGIFTSHVQAVGLLQAYVCAQCGYTELYTRNAKDIPVDGTTVREIVGAAPEGAYR